MDDFTRTITLFLSACILIFGVAAAAASMYGILVWYPRYREQRVEALKLSGRQGTATILEFPEGNRPNHVRRAVFIRTPIRLEISVSGVEIFEVNKYFTIPSHAMDQLKRGRVVAVWVDPSEPHNPDKIVINI